MLNLYRYPVLAVAALLLLISLGGCPKSDEEKAAIKVANRKGPAQVRFINFTEKDLGVEWSDM